MVNGSSMSHDAQIVTRHDGVLGHHRLAVHDGRSSLFE